MKARIYNFAVGLSLLAGTSSRATVFYVSASSTNPVVPYSSWATAATNIQDAVGRTFNGDVVMVTNGVYQSGGSKVNSFDVTNRVTVLNAATVESVNGPAVTIIQGYQPVGASNANNAVRCAYLGNNAILAGFTLTGGQAGTGNYINGGGVSGASGAVSSVISNCVLTGNIASGGGGGAYFCTLVNCVLTGNMASDGGGAASCMLNNCTLVENAANGPATAPHGGGADNCILNNCIAFYNTAVATGSSNYSGSKFNNSCTAPGTGGNITNAPGFLNLAAGNFHLQIGSPCIDAGNNAYVTTTTDLDGNPRIVNGTVDMGAYEYAGQYTGPVHYVSLASTNPLPPYTNWATAATNIQDAIGAAQAGEYVVAGDGNYNVGGTVVFGAETNRVAITNPVTVLSVSGPLGATITGGTQMRCAYVGSNAVLSGFTLAGGKATLGGNLTNELSGGGTWCEPSGVVSNCVFSGNAAGNGYSGYGGGDYGGTVWNSMLMSNAASYGGGAAFANVVNCTLVTNSANGNRGGGVYEAVVSNCLIISNLAYTDGGGAAFSTLYNSTLRSNSSESAGGGADTCVSYSCIFNGNHGGAGGGTQYGTNFNCTISGNSGLLYGGGTYYSTNYNCVLTGNSAGQDGGGALGGVLCNCIVEGNTTTNSGGLGGGIYLANAVNCTIISNNASSTGGGAVGGVLYNCIVYFNTAPSGSNWSGGSLAYCCTVPPGSPAPAQTFCFSNPPVFVNLAGGDLHQATNSPTINGGFNNYTKSPTVPATLTNDFDGNPRIAGGTVDVGAYEYQGSNLGLPIPIPWLMGFNLPTDGSADYLDSDGDGANNWQEWFAGTNPKNPSSVLKMLPPTATNNPAGVVVTWQSAAGRSYYLQRATDPGAVPTFQPLASNIIGSRTATVTSYTDTSATGPGPYYYRVGINSQ